MISPAARSVLFRANRVLRAVRVLRRLAETKTAAELSEPSARTRLRNELAFVGRPPYDRAAEERARAAVDAIRGPYVGALERIFGAVRSGSMDQVEGERSILAAIRDAFSSAFFAGRASLGTGLEKASPEDPETVLRAAEYESGFAGRFFGQFLDAVSADPETSTGDYAWRFALYGRTLDGVFGLGQVSGLPDDTTIDWNLGATDAHCQDCLALASESPFGIPGNTIGLPELPTQPRAGDTCILSPAAKVLTRRGLLPIRDVSVGDEVWTHRARWRRVLATPRTASFPGRRSVHVLGHWGRSVGFTADHRCLTFDGWAPAECAVNDLVLMIHWQDAKILREVLGADAIGSPIESLPTVRECLLLRAAERSTGGWLPDMCRSRVSRLELAGSGCCGTAPGSDPGVRASSAPSLRGPRRGVLHFSEKRWPTLRSLLGRREVALHLPLSVALGTNPRTDTGRTCPPSQERGSFRRSDRKSRVKIDWGSCSGSSGRPNGPDACRTGRLADRCSRVDMPNLRNAISGLSAMAREDPSVLLEGMSGPKPFHGRHSRANVYNVRKNFYAPTGTWSDPAVLFTPLRRRSAREPSKDLDLSSLWAEFCPTTRPRSGPAFLFESVLAGGETLYDLTVEEDHSFVVEGIVVSNSCLSNCLCSLEISSASFGDIARPTSGGSTKSKDGEELSAGDQSRSDVKEALSELDELQDLRVYYRQRQDAAATDDEEAAAAHMVADAQERLNRRAEQLGIDYRPNQRVADYLDPVHRFVDDQGWSRTDADGFRPGDFAARLDGTKITVGRVVADEKAPSGLALEDPRGGALPIPTPGKEPSERSLYLRQPLEPPPSPETITPPEGGLGPVGPAPLPAPGVPTATLPDSGDFLPVLRAAGYVAGSLGDPIVGLPGGLRAVELEGVKGKALVFRPETGRGLGDARTRADALEAYSRLARDLAVGGALTTAAASIPGLGPVALAATPTTPAAGWEWIADPTALAVEDLAGVQLLDLLAAGAGRSALLSRSPGGVLQIDSGAAFPLGRRPVGAFRLFGGTGVRLTPRLRSSLETMNSLARLEDWYGDILGSLQLQGLLARIGAALRGDLPLSSEAIFG